MHVYVWCAWRCVFIMCVCVHGAWVDVRGQWQGLGLTSRLLWRQSLSCFNRLVPYLEAIISLWFSPGALFLK